MRPDFSIIADAARNLFFAAVGFCGACWLITQVIPKPTLPHTIREKIADLTTHGAEYDAIFLGSSRIQNHIIPNLFDRLVSERGAKMKSFNFGISSMHTPEDDYLLDLILAQPHDRLRWIFIEIDFFDDAVQKDEDGTWRGLYWHDWPRLCSLFQCLFAAKDKSIVHRIRNTRDNIPIFLTHANLFLQRSVSLGRGAELLRDGLLHIPAEAMDMQALGEWQDGWLPAIPPRTNLTQEHSDSLRNALKERIAKPPKRDEADPGSQHNLSSILQKITIAGATPVLIIPPRIRQYYFYPERALAERYPIIDLCDPIHYPDLYRYDLRIDGSHLNRNGAEVITRIVAERVFSILLSRQKAATGDQTFQPADEPASKSISGNKN